MARSYLGTINPSTTSGTQLAAMLSNRDLAENSGHSGSGRPDYATTGMIYTDDSFLPAHIFIASPSGTPDVDLTLLFSPRAGTLRHTAEIRLPAGWLWCDGSAVARVTYPALYDATCPAFTGTVAAGSAIVTAVSESFVGLGIVGAVIEGAGIPASPQVTVTAVSATTLTMSAPATAAFANEALRVYPHGVGVVGGTTFNLPNLRGRTIIPRSDMGGSGDNGLITVAGAGFDGTRIAAAGGAQTRVLVAGNLPAHTHPITVSNNGSTLSSDGSHAHSWGGTFYTSADGNHVHPVNPAGQIVTYQGGPNGRNFTVSDGSRMSASSMEGGGVHTHSVSVGSVTTPDGLHSHTLTLALSAASSAPTDAASTPLNTVQPGIVENVIIKF